MIWLFIESHRIRFMARVYLFSMKAIFDRILCVANARLKQPEKIWFIAQPKIKKTVWNIWKSKKCISKLWVASCRIFQPHKLIIFYLFSLEIEFIWFWLAYLNYSVTISSKLHCKYELNHEETWKVRDITKILSTNLKFHVSTSNIFRENL